MTTHPPHLAKETIVNLSHRFTGVIQPKGGHGQFGDVYLEIKPHAARGFKGYNCWRRRPCQYIPVEMGARISGTRTTRLPIVDVAVTLTNGSYHTVDSSKAQAARIAMQTGISQCEPTLLEPITLKVTTTSEFTSKVLQSFAEGKFWAV